MKLRRSLATVSTAVALLAVSNGAAIVTENVFDGRFGFVEELHRMGADGSRAVRLRVGIRCAIAGMVLMAVSIVTAVFTVARFVFDTGVALALAGVIVAAFFALWFGLGRFRRLG